jgi:hypothetical protein
LRFVPKPDGEYKLSFYKDKIIGSMHLNMIEKRDGEVITPNSSPEKRYTHFRSILLASPVKIRHLNK